MQKAEPEKQKGFFGKTASGISRAVYALSLFWAAKFVWKSTTYVLAWGYGSLLYMYGQLQAYSKNRNLAKTMRFSDFVKRQGLEGEDSDKTKLNIEKKKKLLIIEIVLMLVFLAFETAMVVSQPQTLIKVQAGLAVFVIACMLYIRSWNYTVLNNKEYIYLPLWLFGLPYLFKSDNKAD